MVAEPALYPAAEAPGERAEAPSRRVDHEFVAVPMQPEQETVYGWFGLSPALLLDPIPTADNLLVRVVRPGADPEAVLEEARQQMAATGSRRRRRGRSGEGRPTGGEGGGEPTAEVRVGSAPELTIEPLMPSQPAPLPEPVDDGPLPEALPAETVSVALPSRRRRRSSSGAPEISEAIEATSPAAVAVATGAETAELPAAGGPAPAESEDASEPRRRRRRSSASV